MAPSVELGAIRSRTQPAGGVLDRDDRVVDRRARARRASPARTIAFIVAPERVEHERCRDRATAAPDEQLITTVRHRTGTAASASSDEDARPMISASARLSIDVLDVRRRPVDTVVSNCDAARGRAASRLIASSTSAASPRACLRLGELLDHEQQAGAVGVRRRRRSAAGDPRPRSRRRRAAASVPCVSSTRT